MRGIRTSYAVVIALTWFLNGIALLQHLGLMPEIKGLLAAVLPANMLAVPMALWAAFVFGEVVEGETPHRLHRRANQTRAAMRLALDALEIPFRLNDGLSRVKCRRAFASPFSLNTFPQMGLDGDPWP